VPGRSEAVAARSRVTCQPTSAALRLRGMEMGQQPVAHGLAGQAGEPLGGGERADHGLALALLVAEPAAAEEPLQRAVPHRQQRGVEHRAVKAQDKVEDGGHAKPLRRGEVGIGGHLGGDPGEQRGRPGDHHTGGGEHLTGGGEHAGHRPSVDQHPVGGGGEAHLAAEPAEQLRGGLEQPAEAGPRHADGGGAAVQQEALAEHEGAHRGAHLGGAQVAGGVDLARRSGEPTVDDATQGHPPADPSRGRRPRRGALVDQLDLGTAAPCDPRASGDPKGRVASAPTPQRPEPGAPPPGGCRGSLLSGACQKLHS
jgi:hypothetical protein